MRSEEFGWVMLIVGCMLILIAAIIGGQQGKECEAKGGILVKTSGGYVCAKNIEKAKL